jgi:hypothetical protein
MDDSIIPLYEVHEYPKLVSHVCHSFPIVNTHAAIAVHPRGEAEWKAGVVSGASRPFVRSPGAGSIGVDTPKPERV